jgi:hypothetical protein
VLFIKLNDTRLDAANMKTDLNVVKEDMQQLLQLLRRDGIDSVPLPVVRGLSLPNRRSYREIHAVPKTAIGHSELQVEDKVDGGRDEA